MLDEQLSRGIEEVFSQTNFFPTPPSSLPSPTPMLPMTTFTPPEPAYFPRLSPSPPQLPALEFPNFGTNIFPQLAPMRPLTPPSPIVLPDWCPALPCLTRNGIWSDGLPRFYDLSGLPESNQTSKQEPKLCTELQLWRGNLDLKPKHSRFFPSQQTAKKPTVKLPPSACKLHMMEKGLPDPLSSPLHPPSYADVVKTGTSSCNNESVSEAIAASTIPLPSTPAMEPTPANLWRILAAKSTKDRHESMDPYLVSFGTSAAEQGADSDPYLAAWQAYLEDNDRAHVIQEHTDADNNPYMGLWHGYAEADDQATVPAELDGKELPYVHANSLTGHTNEIALSPYAVEHPAMTDSAVCFTPLPSPQVGLNELLVDMDILGEPTYQPPTEYTGDATESSPLCPTPSSISHTYVLADILPVDCVVESDGGERTLITSDAHFQSEQELFEAPATSSKSPGGSTIDVADFLKLGHAKNCWCSDCEAETTAASTPQPAETPELVAMDKLTEMEDDWMLYSGPDDQSTATQLGSEIDDEEKETARVRCGSAPEWDDFFPSVPKNTWEDALARHKKRDVDARSEECDFIWDMDF